MSAALQPSMDRDGFLRWAERQEGRHEFDGLRPVAMADGTLRHGRLTGRIRRELERALAGKPREPFGPNAGIATAADGVRYPDAVVTCSPVTDDLVRLLPDPIMVFEVVSPSTAMIDRIVKLREYAAIPSIVRYVIVESDDVAITAFWRQPGEPALRAEGAGPGQSLSFPELGIDLPVDPVYAGIVTRTTDTGR